MEDSPLVGQVPEDCAGARLDVVLAQLFPQYSRQRLQHWIRTGCIRVEGQEVRPRHAVRGGEQVEVWPQQVDLPQCEPQDLPLEVVYADDDLIVINKPTGQVMHQAPGHAAGTLQSALLFHFPATRALPRAGIVHRLDRDTSGLVMVAHSVPAHTELVRQLQERAVGRNYQALVHGELITGGTVEAALGRDSRHRQKMAVRSGGRQAITHYRIRQRLNGFTLLDVQLETGRTHQIRVHLMHLGYPVVGDPVYGGRACVPKGVHEQVRDMVRGFTHQALHAERLEVRHPTHGTSMQWQVEPPSDFKQLLQCLMEDSGD